MERSPPVGLPRGRNEHRAPPDRPVSRRTRRKPPNAARHLARQLAARLGPDGKRV